jgi:hypothetical protein
MNTSKEFLDKFPSTQQHTLQADLKDVSDWLRCKPEQLQLRLVNLSAEIFYQMAQDMLGTYEEFPEDEARTRKILKALQAGESVLPVFVEDGDASHFIMEGRHRIVAFIQSGLSEIPVAFVSKNQSLTRNFSHKAVKSVFNDLAKTHF